MNKTKEARPEWADVSRFADNISGQMTAVEDLGLFVSATPKGYSVVDDLIDQVAVFKVTAEGQFQWGWVQHIGGGGRTDFEYWPAFLASLTAYAAFAHSPERTTR